MVRNLHDIQPFRLPPDSAIAAIAARQHGVIARHQLEAVGLGRGAVRYRVSIGRLHRLHTGVFAVGHSRVGNRGRWMAAVLACGAGAVLSHRSAAALQGLAAIPNGPVEVTTAERGCADRPGVRLHRVRALDPRDRTVLVQIPVTAIARTLLDLSEVASSEQLARALDGADRARLLDVRAIVELCERSPGRCLRQLRGALSTYERVDDTRSHLERRFLDFCRAAGVPLPSLNVLAAGLEVDALWPRERLVVELDGFAFHRTRAAFERDRSRDAALQLAGYRVLRVTYRMLENEPEAIAERIGGLLAAGVAAAEERPIRP